MAPHIGGSSEGRTRGSDAAAALEPCGFDPTIDRHGISGGEDWKQRLGGQIHEAGTVVFVLSPASAKSEVCAWEVDEAARLSKADPADSLPPSQRCSHRPKGESELTALHLDFTKASEQAAFVSYSRDDLDMADQVVAGDDEPCPSSIPAGEVRQVDAHCAAGLHRPGEMPWSPSWHRSVVRGLEAKLVGAAMLSRQIVRIAHEGGVSSASFSRDGARIVTASRDKMARVWDAASGKEA